MASGRLTYAADLVTMRLHGWQPADACMAWPGPRVIPEVFAGYATTVYLLWFSLVLPNP